MLSRRMFTGCSIYAAIGFVADDAPAQAPNGIRRTITSRVDGPIEGYEMLQVLVDIEPNFVIASNTHPGTAAADTLAGGGELRIECEEENIINSNFWWTSLSNNQHLLNNKLNQTAPFFCNDTTKRNLLPTIVPATT